MITFQAQLESSKRIHVRQICCMRPRRICLQQHLWLGRRSCDGELVCPRCGAAGKQGLNERDIICRPPYCWGPSRGHLYIYIHIWYPQKRPPSLQDRVNTSKTEESRLKAIEPIEFQLGPGLGSWVLAPIEISIGSTGFNRDPKCLGQDLLALLDLGSRPI